MSSTAIVAGVFGCLLAVVFVATVVFYVGLALAYQFRWIGG
jgi:hypothetical protein